MKDTASSLSGEEHAPPNINNIEVASILLERCLYFPGIVYITQDVVNKSIIIKITQSINLLKFWFNFGKNK